MTDNYLFGLYLIACLGLAVFVWRKLRSKLAGVLAAAVLMGVLANVTAAVCGSQCWPAQRVAAETQSAVARKEER